MALPFNFEGDGEDKEFIFSEDFLTIEHSGKSEVAKSSVRSHHPIPLSCELFYYEVTILQMNGKNARVGVGFKEIHNSKYSLPGQQFDSYGLLTDGFFQCHRSYKVCDRPIPAGSTIGCGVDLTYKRIFFTLKGKRIGHSIGIPLDFDLYPSVGIAGGAKVQANFGLTSFKYNLEEYTAYCQQNLTHWLNRPVIGPLETTMQSLTLEETLCRLNQSNLFYDQSHLHLPQHWNISDRRRSLLVSKCGSSVLLESMGRNDEEAATIRSNAPIPSSCPFYYYEVRIDSCGQSYGSIEKGTISVGFSVKTAPLYELPGWNCKSIGYHGNDGKFFGRADFEGCDYGPAFKNGDVIGCMLNFEHKEYFFTRNGKRLGNINALMSWMTRSMFETNQGIYPAVGTVNKYAEVCANFGQRPFCFDLIQYVKDISSKKVLLTRIQNKNQQQQGDISPYLLNSSSSSCSPCNSVEVVCQVCDSANNANDKMLNCDRCDLNYHENCLHQPLSQLPAKNKEWICSKCQEAIDLPHKVPVYAEVSPVQISTRVHPLKRFSCVSMYQPLTHTLSCLAVEPEEEEDEDVKVLSQNAEDVPLNGAYQSLRTADLFCNLGDDVLLRNSKLQYARNNLPSKESPAAIQDDCCQRADGQRSSRISKPPSITPRARTSGGPSVGPSKKRRASTPGPGSCSHHTVQAYENSSFNQPLQKSVIRLTESSVQAASMISTSVQTSSNTYKAVETQTATGTLDEPSKKTDHKVTTLDMASQTTQQNTSNNGICNMKQIFYNYLKPTILKQCKQIDDFICQKNCKQAIENIDRDFPEVFEKKKDLKILLEIFDFSDCLWQVYGPDSSVLNDKTGPSDQASTSRSSADEPSTGGTSEAIKNKTEQCSANLEFQEVLRNQIVMECELQSVSFLRRIRGSVLELSNIVGEQAISPTLDRALKEADHLFWHPHSVAQGSSYLYSREQRERLSEYVLLCIIFGFSQLQKNFDDI